MRTSVIIFLITLSAHSYAQTFQTAIGGTGSDYGHAIALADDGGYYIAGSSNSYSTGGDLDIFLVKVNCVGRVEWAKTYGGSGKEEVWNMIILQDGSIVLSGSTQSYGPGTSTSNNMFIMRLKKDGTQLWFKFYGNSRDERDGTLLEASNGDIIHAFCTEFTVTYEYALIRMDTSGTILKQQRYTVEAEPEGFNDLIEMPSGKFIAAAQGHDYGFGLHEAMVIMMDKDFNIIWNRMVGNSSRDFFFSVLYEENKIILGGETNGYGAGGRDMVLCFFDTLGNMQSFHTYGGSDWDQGGKVFATPDGGYALLGETETFGAGNYDLLLLKLDTAGNVEWNRTYGDSWDQRNQRAWVDQILLYHDTGYVLCSQIRDYGAGGYDMLLVKTNDMGLIDSCSIPSHSISHTTHTPKVDSVDFDVYSTIWDTLILTSVDTPIVTYELICGPVAEWYIDLIGDFLICQGDTSVVQVNSTLPMTWLPSPYLLDHGDSVALFPPTRTYFSYELLVDSGCYITDSLEIDIMPKFASVITPDTFVCEGSSVMLVAAGGTQIRWSPSTGLSDTTSFSTIASPTSTTLYRAVHSDDCYTDTNYVLVGVKPPPEIVAKSDTTICWGDSAQLSTRAGLFYNWSPVGSLSDSKIRDPIAFPSSSTVYHLQVTDSFGCTNEDSVNVDVSIITVSAYNDTVICPGDTVTLAATGGISFSWIPSSALSSPTSSSTYAYPDSTTTFTVVSADSFGCLGVDSVRVDVRTVLPKYASQDTGICPGGSVMLGSYGGSTYIWTPSATLSSDNIADPLASPSSTTWYTVAISDECETVNDSVLVDIYPEPTADAGLDTLVCEGDTIVLSARGGLDYAWSPDTLFITPFLSSVVIIPDVDRHYSVQVTNEFGCSDIDSVLVRVMNCDPIPVCTLAIPNAFTPDELLNYEFGPISICIEEIYEFKIFNRYGQIVFEGNSNDYYWDGTFNGVEQEMAVYVYLLNARLTDGQEYNLVGNLTLLR